MSSKTERIVHDNEVLAIILRGDTYIDGTEFLTPNEYPFQMGVHSKKTGDESKPHIHKSVPRTITASQEMLHIDHGKVEVSFFGKDFNKLETKTLSSGDTVLFVRGGHGIKFLEDSKIIEVKQGPYEGAEKDKEYVE